MRFAVRMSSITRYTLVHLWNGVPRGPTDLASEGPRLLWRPSDLNDAPAAFREIPNGPSLQEQDSLFSVGLKCRVSAFGP